MDKNGYIMGVAGSFKVVFSKSQKQVFINQAGNWKWVSFIDIGTGYRNDLKIVELTERS